MARGRLLLTTISDSEKVNSLGSDFAQLLFCFLIPHADMNGREKANPRLVRGKIVPLIDCDEDKVGAAIYRMHEVGLVALYESDGLAYLEFTGWAHNQTIRKDREQPRYPDQTAVFPQVYERYRRDSWTAPGALREQSAPTEPNPTEPNPTQSNESSASPNRSESTPATVARARCLPINYEVFVNAWNDTAGTLPSIRRLNDNRRRGIKRLIEEHGDEALALFRDAARQVASDPFWIEKQYGWDNLVPGKVLEKAEKLRNARGLSSADARLAKDAEGWLRAAGGSHEH